MGCRYYQTHFVEPYWDWLALCKKMILCCTSALGTCLPRGFHLLWEEYLRRYVYAWLIMLFMYHVDSIHS